MDLTNDKLAEIDLSKLDLTMVFWDEVLEAGATIRDEIKTQAFSFIYYMALDMLPDGDPSVEDDEALQKLVQDYISQEKMQDWITEKEGEVQKFLASES